MKFGLLANGLVLSTSALEALTELNGDRSLTPHDYASTSGVILNLADDVWVNAPIELYNPNFVDRSPYRLSYHDGFFVEGAGLASRASYWPQPRYHGTEAQFGQWNSYVFSHGDRARLAPIQGCAMTCTFCNIPYDFPIQDYSLKPIDALVASAGVALSDELQPARHLLISGGTPKPKDVNYLREFYATILAALPRVDIDLMMVPLPGLYDLPRLAALGLHELSINLEIFNRDRAREYARQKYTQGLDFYLNFIESATKELGPGRARSMLMVGLEPLEDTLAGVRAIAERGGTPVLSPFRPDPVTPLAQMEPPSAQFLRTAYERASEIVAEYGSVLGPDCPPCTHNTLNFATSADEKVTYLYERPLTLGAHP